MKPMRILVSGSSGFVGKHLVTFLVNEGHDVCTLRRNSKNLEEKIVFWDPRTGEFKKEDFEGFDAVIHLAGKNIGTFWTKKHKEEIFLSRCRDTWLLSQVLLRLYRPPKCFISASAIGFYGDRGNEVLTEASSQGKGFLADVTQKWEEASTPLENRGIRVVHARFGVILGPSGGMLHRMTPIFKLGLGAKIGTGAQKISWIALDDVVAALYYILMHENLSGVFNFTAPHPVSQQQFAKKLAETLQRPLFFHVPKFVIHALLGEMGDELMLASTYAVPEKLVQSGYSFRYENLEEALQAYLLNLSQ